MSEVGVQTFLLAPIAVFYTHSQNGGALRMGEQVRSDFHMERMGTPPLSLGEYTTRRWVYK